MARDGVFKDVDTAISWHPATFNSVNKPNSLANIRIDFTFFGKAAHAAIAPHLGRSALDAIELMNVGVIYMREHMPVSAKFIMHIWMLVVMQPMLFKPKQQFDI